MAKDKNRAGTIGSSHSGQAVLMVTQAAAAKLAGFVVDAASRDTYQLAEGSFPIFAAGKNSCGPTKGLPGTIGMPVSVGGVAVNPGDLIVGDADGVVVNPYAQVDAVLDAAEKNLEAEKIRLDEIARGLLASPWLNDASNSAGLPPVTAGHSPDIKHYFIGALHIAQKHSIGNKNAAAPLGNRRCVTPLTFDISHLSVAR